MNKKFIGLGLASVAALSLAACGSRTAKNDSSSSDSASSIKAGIVTDIGWC